MTTQASKSRRKARALADGAGICHWCDTPVRMVMKTRLPPDAATIDHVYVRKDPRRLALATQTQIITVVIACFRCNQERGETPYDEFLLQKRPEWRTA